MCIRDRDNISYRTEVFQIDTGWGYKIYKNGKLYIEQRLIPAVNGHFLFETYEDAFQTGVFVMNRMSEQKGLPSVSIEELDSLGVLYQEVKEFQEIDFSTKKGNIPYNKDK
mgnify:CR=1 FL=1